MSLFLLIKKMSPDTDVDRLVLDTRDVQIGAFGEVGASYTKENEYGTCLQGIGIPDLEPPVGETNYFDVEMEGQFFVEFIPLPFDPNTEDTWKLKDKNYLYYADQLPKAFKSNTDRITVVALPVEEEGKPSYRIINNEPTRGVLRVYMAGGEIRYIRPLRPVDVNNPQFVGDSVNNESVSIILAPHVAPNWDNALSYAGVVDMGSLDVDERAVAVSVNGGNYTIVDTPQELQTALTDANIDLVELTEWTPDGEEGGGGELPSGTFSYAEFYYDKDANNMTLWVEATEPDSKLAITTPTGVGMASIVNGEEELHYPYEKGMWKIEGNITSILTPIYYYADSALVNPPGPVTDVIKSKRPDGKWEITCKSHQNTVCGLIPAQGNGGEPIAFAIPDPTGVVTFTLDLPNGWTGSIRASTSGGGSTGEAIVI